ncbi:uncharacterized protein [Amphiura filiformis]|uniref:uncharacterized protein n=1 Tax=Amphiura filiformis TaxID=82378 RepID=UPI003B225584
MSISLCIERCESLNLRYAGLEAHDECFCGTETRQYDKYGRIADSKCSKTCAGNVAEDCGGEYLLSVYDVPTAASAGKCGDPGVPQNGFRSDQNITKAQTVDLRPTMQYNSTNITNGNITNGNITFQNHTGNYSTSMSSTLLPMTSPTLTPTTIPSSTTPIVPIPSNITFNFHSIVYFACEDEYDLEGVTSLECVIGSTPDEVKWDGEIPACFLITTLAPTTTPVITTTTAPTTTQPTTTLMATTTLPPLPTVKPAKSTAAGPLVGAVLACLLLLILFLIAVHFYIKKRKQKAATQPISTPREPRTDEEAGLATNIELEMEANSNGTNESPVLETNEEGRFEEEIDLNNVPETHSASDENVNDAWVGDSGGAAVAAGSSNANNGTAENSGEYANEDGYEYVDDDDDDDEYEYEYVYENEGDYNSAEDGHNNNAAHN